MVLSRKQSGIISKNETYLEFVGRVERNLSHFLVLCSNIHNITQNDFSKFQQSSFRGITYHNSLCAQQKKLVIAHRILHFHQRSLHDSVTGFVLKQQWIYTAIFRSSWKSITVEMWGIFATAEVKLVFDTVKADLWSLSGFCGGSVMQL